MIRTALNWKIRFFADVCLHRKNMRKKTYGITYAPWQWWRKSWTNKWNCEAQTYGDALRAWSTRSLPRPTRMWQCSTAFLAKVGKYFRWNKKFSPTASQAIPSRQSAEEPTGTIAFIYCVWREIRACVCWKNKPEELLLSDFYWESLAYVCDASHAIDAEGTRKMVHYERVI